MEELYIDEKRNLELDKSKNDFFDTTVGKVIDNTVNIAIKALVPDIIDDQVINVKDAIIEGGFKEGLEEIKRSGTNFKESIKGIITGEFKTIEQMKIAIKDGGILDFVSLCVDKGIKCLSEKTGIDKSTLILVSSGKDLLVNQITSSIENKFTEQLEEIERLDKYCEEWKEAYNNKDLGKINIVYEKIEDSLENVIQIESVLNKVNNIKNLNELINSSGNFDLTDEELNLAKKI